MELAVTSCLKHLGLLVSRRYCKKLIRSYSDYPSFLSVADTLQRLQNLALRSNKVFLNKGNPPALVSAYLVPK